MRLNKRAIDYGGRLEVCSDGRWKSVCGTGVGEEIATVVCRQLNHAAAGVLCKKNGLTLLPLVYTFR